VTVDLRPLTLLRLRTARLTLRLPTPAELGELAAIAAAGVHESDRMPFLVPWTDHTGDPGFADEFAAFHLGLRSDWSPEDWHLELGVWVDERLAGVQSANGARFASEHRVNSGSWLGQAFHGRGIGTEMLALAFDGLGARLAVSGAFEDNPASARVSEKLAYAEVGVTHVTVRDLPVRQRRFELTRAGWEHDTRDRWPTTIEGLDGCRHLFGDE
jgi:RimJ/RimL family protein N-acetyltransferase